MYRVRGKSKQNNLFGSGKVVRRYGHMRTITIDDKKKPCTPSLVLCMINKMLQQVQCSIVICVACLSGTKEGFIV